MTMTFIQRVELTSATATISITNIPQSYTDLLIFGSFRFARGTVHTPVRLLLNGSGFTARNIYAEQATGALGSQNPTTNYIGWAPGNSNSAGSFGGLSVYIPNYTTSVIKSFFADVISENSGADKFLALTGGRSITTSPITTIAFSDEAVNSNFAIGSSVTIYGIKSGSGGVAVS